MKTVLMVVYMVFLNVDPFLPVYQYEIEVPAEVCDLMQEIAYPSMQYNIDNSWNDYQIIVCNPWEERI